jgi:hypothetical protein
MGLELAVAAQEAEMKTQHTLSTLLAASLLMAACGGGGNPPADSGNSGVNGPTPSTSSTSTASTRTAEISELRNNVEARQTTGLDWGLAADGQEINAGGGVRTGDESRVRIDTSDNSIIRIGANTEFQLLEFSPQAENSVTRMQLDAGQVWAQVTKELGTGTFEVETPAGVATVRGSLMSVAFDAAAGQLAVTCLEGECELRDRAQNAVRLVAGEAAEIVGVGQGPGAARRMRRAEIQAWIDNFPEAGEIARRLLAGLIEDTPTPSGGSGAGGVGQTACDHPYFPMRPGATWTYDTTNGQNVWTVTSITGDAQSANAVMTFTAPDVQVTYNWACTAEGGLVSYDFGSFNVAELGTVVSLQVNNATGVWLPPASLLTVGYGWTNAYETVFTITSADIGEGSAQSATAESVTVAGAEPVNFGGQTLDGVQLSRTGTQSFQMSIGGFSGPGQSVPINSTMVLARGVGIVSIVDDVSSTQLVSYSLP